MKTIKLDDFKNYEFLSNLKFSEDGRYAAYICAHADLTENDYNKALFLLDMETKKTKQLTGEDVNSFYGFDGDRLLFLQEEQKKKRKKKRKPLFMLSLFRAVKPCSPTPSPIPF